MFSKSIREKVAAKGKRLIALTALCTCMFTSVAMAANYNGNYGNARLDVTTANGLKRAIAETVPYPSRGCYYANLKVTTVYEDGSEYEVVRAGGREGRAYYQSSYEDAEDYTSFHEFYDYYNTIRLDYCTLYE